MSHTMVSVLQVSTQKLVHHLKAVTSSPFSSTHDLSKKQHQQLVPSVGTWTDKPCLAFQKTIHPVHKIKPYPRPNTQLGVDFHRLTHRHRHYSSRQFLEREVQPVLKAPPHDVRTILRPEKWILNNGRRIEKIQWIQSLTTRTDSLEAIFTKAKSGSRAIWFPRSSSIFKVLKIEIFLHWEVKRGQWTFVNKKKKKKIPSRSLYKDKSRKCYAEITTIEEDSTRTRCQSRGG